MAALAIIRFLFRLKDVDASAIADGRVLVARVDAGQPSGFIHQYEAQGGGGGGAPTTVDYLVGTADATLTNEIVVGVTPGGELGGTWAAPTVDAVHSGSSHAQTQAAAEATAAAALAAHVAVDVIDGDAAGGVLSGTYPNPGFAVDMATQAELDAHISDPTDAHAGTAIGNTPAGGIIATTVQAAINELDTEKANVANAVMDGDAAGGVLSGTYPNPGFAVDMATQAELDAHINDATDAHAGTAIGNTPAGGIAATTVQAAINELDSEKVSTATFDDHSARHENGGADEISVAGLSGELADAQPVTVRKNTGADVGTRSRLNFIEGTNVTLTVTDDAGSDEIDVTIASSGWTYVVKTADESNASNTTVQNDDELFFTAAAATLYHFECWIIYGSPAGAGTPDFKADFGEDATTRGEYEFLARSTTDANAVAFAVTNQGSNIVVGTAAADRILICRGFHRGNGGTFRLRWSQNTSGVNPTIVRAGSVLKYRAII